VIQGPEGSSAPGISPKSAITLAKRFRIWDSWEAVWSYVIKRSTVNRFLPTFCFTMRKCLFSVRNVHFSLDRKMNQKDQGYENSG
jgi:hypothetical protein